MHEQTKAERDAARADRAPRGGHPANRPAQTQKRHHLGLQPSQRYPALPRLRHPPREEEEQTRRNYHAHHLQEADPRPTQGAAQNAEGKHRAGEASQEQGVAGEEEIQHQQQNCDGGGSPQVREGEKGGGRHHCDGGGGVQLAVKEDIIPGGSSSEIAELPEPLLLNLQDPGVRVGQRGEEPLQDLPQPDVGNFGLQAEPLLPLQEQPPHPETDRRLREEVGLQLRGGVLLTRLLEQRGEGDHPLLRQREVPILRLRPPHFQHGARRQPGLPARNRSLRVILYIFRPSFFSRTYYSPMNSIPTRININ